MKSISIERKILLPFLAAMAAFITSRVMYDRAGIRFDGDLYLGYDWHFIDPALLATDLWQSLFYLHSQPPLMNLLAGITLQVFPTNYQEVFHILYFILGVLLAGGIYLLGLSLRLQPWLSGTLTAWFMCSPGTVLYEHQLMYGYPIATQLTLAGVFLFHFSLSEKKYWGTLFFGSLSMVALLWSLFHILWLYLTLIFAWKYLPARKIVVLTALIPVTLVTAWYAKNLFQVGEFTASTWAGMNISKIVTFRTPEKERKQWVKSGELSRFALIPPFRNPILYLELLPDTPTTGIPLLDETETSLGTRNFHHLVFVQASEYYLKDALTVIRLSPQYYARSIRQAFYIYFHSPSDFDPVLENRSHILAVDTWWNRLFYGQWQNDETSIERDVSMSFEHVGWTIVFVFFTAVIGASAHLWRQRGRLSEPLNLLILFMLNNILFVTIVGNSLDIGENNRFRFTIDPFLLLLFVFVVRNAGTGFLAHKAGNQKGQEARDDLSNKQRPVPAKKGSPD